MTADHSDILEQAQADIETFLQHLSAVEEQGTPAQQGLVEGIWAYDVRNNRVYWEEPLFGLFEFPTNATPMTLATLTGLVHPEDRQEFGKYIQAGLTSGKDIDLDLRMRHSTGRYLSIRLSGKVHRDAGGQPDRISGRMLHMSELQQAESSLREVNKELSDIRRVLDESTVVSVTDRYGVISYINDALCRISQYSREELIGETLQIINSGTHSETLFQELWNTVERGQVWRGEIPNRARDGSPFWMDTTVVPLFNAHGKPFQYVVVRHEISRQKAAEQESHELEADIAQQVIKLAAELETINLAQRLEMTEQRATDAELRKSLKREKLTKHLIQLMNRSSEPENILEIIVQELGTYFNVDRCLVILHEDESETHNRMKLFSQYCSSEKVLPVQESDLSCEWKILEMSYPETELPLVLYNVPAPETFPEDIRPYLDMAGAQSALAVEIKYRHCTFGRLILHQCASSRIWTEQEIDFLQILATHIGAALYQVKLYQQERQAKQEAEEANRQKSKVLSFVSHDFKNPLAGIKGFVDILENDKSEVLSENQREMIGYLSEGVQQLRNMVTDILDKASLSEGKITPIPQWIDLQSFFKGLKSMLSSMATPHNIEISIDIQPDMTAIKADPTHLRQILINLVSNAIKYNRINGKVFLRLYKSQDWQSAVIEVEDNGLGIPEAKMPLLFSEYFRGHQAQYSLVEGTGLGLAFIKRLVELHGGTVFAKSKESEGSTFTVLLPLR